MSDDLVKMARLAQHDERMSTGALYGDLADRIEELEAQVNWYRDRVVWGFYEEETPKFYQGKAGEHEICEPVNAEQVTRYFKALDIYERERIRFKHAKPEMTGEFFIAGSHGPKDDNVMPQFIEVCPAYGVGWVMIYEDTGRTINYEGS